MTPWRRSKPPSEPTSRSASIERTSSVESKKRNSRPTASTEPEASAKGLHGHRCVQVVGQRDDGGVDPVAELTCVGHRAWHAEAAREVLGAPELAVDEHRGARVPRGGERRQVLELRDGAAADDG